MMETLELEDNYLGCFHLSHREYPICPSHPTPQQAGKSPHNCSSSSLLMHACAISVTVVSQSHDLKYPVRTPIDGAKQTDVMNMSEERIKIRPFWCGCNQRIEDDNACVEIELPGVKKRDIDLQMTDDNFSLKAPKGDIEYVGAWTWCCPVDSSKAKAKYDNGLLQIEAPLKAGPPSKRIKIT